MPLAQPTAYVYFLFPVPFDGDDSHIVAYVSEASSSVILVVNLTAGELFNIKYTAANRAPV